MLKVEFTNVPSDRPPGHGYYVMQKTDHSDVKTLNYVREYVYEFLPLKDPAADSKNVNYLVTNKDDNPIGNLAPVELAKTSTNEKSVFNYDGGSYDSNSIKLVVDSVDNDGFSRYNSASMYLDNAEVDSLEPGVHQFDKIEHDGLDVWLLTVKN